MNEISKYEEAKVWLARIEKEIELSNLKLQLMNKEIKLLEDK